MRVGIVTWYGVTNYGSALQAYALQRLIGQEGHESVILRHSVHEPRPGVASRPGVLRRLRQLTPGRVAADRGERAKAAVIASFRAENLTISERYLEETPVDLALIGSDQIFDIRRFHPFQFGVGVNAPRLATYAPSFGETTLADLERSQHLEEVQRALQDLTFLSARDENSRSILEAMTGRTVEAVLDPTLVYDFADETEAWRLAPPYERYALIYTWGGVTTTQTFADAVRQFARRHGLKTVSVGDTRRWCDLNLADISPQGYVSLVSNATVVITSMFHGSCFAIRAGVPLVPIVMPHNENKLGDLLRRSGLDSQRVENVESIGTTDIPEIDYQETRLLLDDARASSLAHLKAALSGRVTSE